MKESEKVLEKKLREKVKELGGLAVKLSADHLVGIPDRMCLMPGGEVFFVEVKTTGEKPRLIQIKVMERLVDLGFKVYVIDSSEKLENMLNERIKKGVNLKEIERKIDKILR